MPVRRVLRTIVPGNERMNFAVARKGRHLDENIGSETELLLPLFLLSTRSFAFADHVTTLVNAFYLLLLALSSKLGDIFVALFYYDICLRNAKFPTGARPTFVVIKAKLVSE